MYNAQTITADSLQGLQGSSKAGVLGDVTVNLADYAAVFNAASVSLPLKASNTGTILHVRSPTF